MALPPLYLISDATRVGDDRFLAVLGAAVSAGLQMVQIREPGWSLGELRDLAARVRELLGPEGLVTLSLHPGEDGEAREEIIHELGLAGGHLGRCGADAVLAARRRLGAELLLGYSAHSPEESGEAIRNGADYVSCSPIFVALSKTGASELLGLDGLRRTCSVAGGPVYALGGVTSERATKVKEVGARGVAVIGALLDAPDPALACRELLAAMA